MLLILLAVGLIAWGIYDRNQRNHYGHGHRDDHDSYNDHELYVPPPPPTEVRRREYVNDHGERVEEETRVEYVPVHGHHYHRRYRRDSSWG